MLKCYTCKQELPESEFYKRSTVRGYQKECKKCCYIRKMAWHKTDEGKRSSANTKLKKRFGLTIEEYEKMEHRQEGKCAICGGTATGRDTRLAIDHCHKTGKIRELLCKPCNLLIGNAKDNVSILESAIQYLLKHKE